MVMPKMLLKWYQNVFWIYYCFSRLLNWNWDPLDLHHHLLSTAVVSSCKIVLENSSFRSHRKTQNSIGLFKSDNYESLLHLCETLLHNSSISNQSLSIYKRCAVICRHGSKRPEPHNESKRPWSCIDSTALSFFPLTYSVNFFIYFIFSFSYVWKIT